MNRAFNGEGNADNESADTGNNPCGSVLQIDRRFAFPAAGHSNFLSPTKKGKKFNSIPTTSITTLYLLTPTHPAKIWACVYSRMPVNLTPFQILFERNFGNIYKRRHAYLFSQGQFYAFHWCLNYIQKHVVHLLFNHKKLERREKQWQEDKGKINHLAAKSTAMVKDRRERERWGWLYLQIFVFKCGRETTPWTGQKDG